MKQVEISNKFPTFQHTSAKNICMVAFTLRILTALKYNPSMRGF